MEMTPARFRVLCGLAAAACLAAGLVAQPQHTAEQDLRDGIALTSRGRFQDAIPHFLAARGQVADSFALEFNLALCYVGTRQFPEAIRILSQIGGPRSNVKNLLAQAYIGAHQPEAALKAFQEAAAIDPKNESLYLQVAQASLDEGFYDLGRQVLDVGLGSLPDSSRLHFERGVFRAQQDDNEPARQDFEAARRLAPNSQTAFIASAEEAFNAGRVEEAVSAARQGIREGYSHYLLLTMLGEGLLRTGATPESPEFKEAQAALEKAVGSAPGYSSARIALGRVYLMLGRVAEAMEQLEAGRRLNPRNPAVYPPLAAAYQRAGKQAQAREALAALALLNRQEADRIRSSGNAGYLSGKPAPQKK